MPLTVYAKKFVGRVFVEFDYKSFHVATMGYCANDQDYIRFSQIDPHSIFTSHIGLPGVEPVNMSWSDSDIKRYCKELRAATKVYFRLPTGEDMTFDKIRQAMGKPTVLGNQLGLGARKLQRQNRRFIHYVSKSERELAKVKYPPSAEELQTRIAEEFRKPEAWKGEIKKLADKQKFLLLKEWGYIQYFFEVYRYQWNARELRWRQTNGADSEKVLAFPVQGYAHGMLKQHGILDCRDKGYTDEHFFVNTIHDSVIYCPEAEKADKAIADIYAEMTKPCRQLVNSATGPKGLKIDCDVSVGLNWAKYSKTNPVGMQEIGISSESGRARVSRQAGFMTGYTRAIRDSYDLAFRA